VSNDTEGPLSQDASHSFVQEVKAFDTASLTLRAEADLSRQAGSTGPVVSLAGLAEHDGRLWVAAEGLDQVIALDPVTLAEVARVDAPGRPRALLAVGDTLHVHGAQGFQVTTIGAGGAAPRTVTTAPDPRPEPIARGQRYFTGQGRSFATTWSCNSCHADALTDTQVWNAGPLVDRVVARPFVWLEGAYPLGWSGYMYDVFNYAYEVNGNVGIRPVTQEATDLGAYLASLTAPPAANDATLLDGRLDAQAERGKVLFEGDAGCVGCHPLPLSTSRKSYTPGITEGVSDVPVLVGAYRYGTWLKHGEARDLRSAVLAAHEWVGGGALTDAQIDDLTHYVAALTGRDFFVLTTTPRADGKPIAADGSIEVTFSLPVWDDPTNLAHLGLTDAAGAAIAHATTVSEDGRHVTLTPGAPLAPDAELHVVVDAALESYDERHALPATFDLRTAHAPAASARLDGDYVWTVAMPSFNPATGFDPSSTFPVSVPVRATPTAGGARLHLDLGQGLELERAAVVDGDQLYMPPLPIPIGPSFGDTVPDAPVALAADAAAGTFTLAGPGFFVPDVAWSLARAPVGCTEGTTGNVTVDMSESGEITWAGGDAALALYVTDAAASIPLGPGAVTGGASYWILQSSAFPAGFAAPVTYGSVPSGAVDAGAASMAHFEPLTSGHCYKVTVTTTAFKQGARTVLWP
jgi:mono/diheme cytochrome c family protein